MESKITKIAAQRRKGRFNIFIDGHYAFPVSENVLIRYQLVKDMVIDESLENQLVSADHIDKIYQKAINYLSGQLRTTQEVVNKLKTETEDSAIIDSVVERLKQNLLLDDQSYANSYVRSEVRIQDKGPTAIKQHLHQKGIADSMIESALDEFYSDDDLVVNGLKQARKMFKRYQNDSFNQAINKVKNGLVRKGYSFEIIDQVIELADFKPDFDHQAVVLKKQFEKSWHRYRRYDQQQRAYKTKQALYRKGFSLDSISQLIDAEIEQ
ncbi:recombination regulator RecX [Nicoliella lavandulae]|uniref:Regulatory protein RecX n=1 Tax=Nicoliella lavandulae TaxID=3082954 RepID=A0ABU8SI44_9LACO